MIQNTINLRNLSEEEEQAWNHFFEEHSEKQQVQILTEMIIVFMKAIIDFREETEN